MITKITGEQPFQVLTNNFSISPSNEGYTLQISADGVNFSNLFQVGANVTRLVTGVAANSYYRLLGNNSRVSINWLKVCVTEGGGSGSGTELTPVTSFPVGAEAGTVVALVSGDTVGVYQYDGENWNETGANVDLSGYTPTSGFSTINGSAITNGGNIVIESGGESVVELTQAQYDALTGYAENTTYIITDANEINLDEYALTADTEAIAADVATLSGDVATKADKANVAARGAATYWLPGWNAQGVITGETRYYLVGGSINGATYNQMMRYGGSQTLPNIFAPTAAGTKDAVLLSNGIGAPVWSTYKFVFISQTDYDALTTKDSTTIYFITGD